MKCSAHTQRGTKCQGQAITGATVCHVHGGAAPQVLAAARMRLLMAADPAAAKLIAIMKSPKTEASAAIAACKEILNRAGVSPTGEVATSGGPQGTVLWEEFCAIYRRRVGVATPATEEIP